MSRIETSYFNTNQKCVEYYVNDLLHRENGPAKIIYDKFDRIICEKYYINNLLHREDGPALIKYDFNREGNIFTVYEEYYINGICHRDDGPATMYIDDYDYFSFTVYIYCKNGICHRDDGPARIIYDSDGNYNYEYYQFGNLHRENGPAIISYDDNGIQNEDPQYYLFGIQLNCNQNNFQLFQNFMKKKISEIKNKNRLKLFTILDDSKFGHINGPDICHYLTEFVY